MIEQKQTFGPVLDYSLIVLNYLLMGQKGALNWFPIMPRGSADRSLGKAQIFNIGQLEFEKISSYST